MREKEEKFSSSQFAPEGMNDEEDGGKKCTLKDNAMQPKNLI